MRLFPRAPDRAYGAATGAPVRAGVGDLFGPRGLHVDAESVWVADTGHHRVLGWPGPEALDGPAHWRLGQSEADGDARNGGGPATATTLNVPVGVCRYRAGLVVADSWNHRILIWDRMPRADGVAPDRVLGQTDFTANLANRGAEVPAADSLHWPSGVCARGDQLVVADSGNRRVLAWNAPPTGNGAAADLVLGQERMDCRDQNAGRALDRTGMVWPHACVRWGDGLAVADAGANRVMLWRRMPGRHGVPCDLILGQADPGGRLHNRGHAAPSGASLAMPYGLAVLGTSLLVADTANSRMLGWHEWPDRDGQAASGLHAQADFTRAGDNRWQNAAPDSLCWPYGVSAQAGWAGIADTGNNRVLLWSHPHDG